MQAVARACSGRRDSSAASNLTCVHQQGGCFAPLARSASMAHWLGCPHSGQRLGSLDKAAGMAGILCAGVLARRECSQRGGHCQRNRLIEVMEASLPRQDLTRKCLLLNAIMTEKI